ncbi:16S rRNA (guanine(527)-N(7))-methyltransferase RsmG [Methylocystis sp. MJC1]|jgi:16S rRNA (guanine527-N7)-methyltransferase|uniref:16S rRNA (guanine(527)-N(7))-methyltransferase RsmG n=1 Tax=Methylocystis sp. MJC1 TaxID=2654282 RepID=UPI0013EC8B84|nr:16S rRNA (guanine(527)-N(7))-methyltransferase RsmG [Methylocystis sp. MJC1]KAF2991888.1 Ribosomal RNA small subunit methyltransferase G [Methylocystis sp. MJC1]MBU6528991.1 16S rRNA (guanine(527)-N(7))-methyltransferase RsmG [Methylocystis sp. MJC1]UZX11871.1 16S rRNA (guanine(527)-N(7))-methyltransferase RsmG [Methylocystis sp. MJC1]
MSRASALELIPSLQKIEGELLIYEELLRRWQTKINLVAPNTLSDIWMRHFADSAQVLEAAPDARLWADIGSGAGFPGLVTALLLKDVAGASVHLVESDQRKAAFLRAVSRETGARVEVHAERIEKVLPTLAEEIEAVSARALAPLSRLVEMAREPLENGAKAVFMKGEEWRDELTAAEAVGNFTFKTVQSRTHKRARLIVVHSPSEANFVRRK